MITVFFDGKCGLCRREIAFYRKRAPEGLIAWVDVMAADFLPEAYPISRTDALKAIHVRDDTGSFRTGADAFSLIWKTLPDFHWLGLLVSSPLILPAARLIYAVFGAVRFRLHRYDRCDL